MPGPVFHGAIGYSQKIFKLVWWCHQLLSWFLAKGHLPRVSLQSFLSANVTVIMRLFRGMYSDLL